MSETAVLLLAILVVSFAVLLSVAFSLARVGPARRETLLPASVLCPTTGDMARVEIGFDPESGRLAVARCAQFPTGVFECERECFPTLVLTPVA